tara:strand:+ start:765 stop:1055 length:291 start_codon:yes stop_codon:yes gene_type:complete
MNGQGDLARFSMKGTNAMKSTIAIDKNDFDNQAKKMVVITVQEQALLLQSIEALEAQAATIRAYLRSIGFDHFTSLTDNPRTVARMQLTVKQDDQS